MILAFRHFSVHVGPLALPPSRNLDSGKAPQVPEDGVGNREAERGHVRSEVSFFLSANSVSVCILVHSRNMMLYGCQGSLLDSDFMGYWGV